MCQVSWRSLFQDARYVVVAAALAVALEVGMLFISVCLFIVGFSFGGLLFCVCNKAAACFVAGWWIGRKKEKGRWSPYLLGLMSVTVYLMASTKWLSIPAFAGTEVDLIHSALALWLLLSIHLVGVATGTIMHTRE